MLELVNYSIAFVVLVCASYVDLRIREVPDWLNYSAAAAGLSISLIYSVIFSTPWPFIFSAAGAIFFLLIGLLMFYAGQWGGGDSKLLIALGALFGLVFSSTFPFIILQQPLISFWINLLFVGVAYALCWSVYLAIKNKGEFRRQFLIITREASRFKITIITLLVGSILTLVMIDNLSIKLPLLGAIIAIVTGTIMIVFARAVEKSSMLKRVHPSKLTEGDWIAEDVYVGKKYVCGPKDLGIEKAQIKLLISYARQRKIKTILIKEGIPFVPSFLLAFLVTIKFGNLLFMLLGLN